MDLQRDNIKKLFYSYLTPAVSSAIAISLYSLVDTIAIGQGVGAKGAAANAIVLPIFSIASTIALIFGIGGSILRSRSKGMGNEEKGNAYFTSATLCTCIVTLIVWVMGIIFQEGFYRLCGADDVLLPYVKDYGEWIFAFLPSFVLTTYLSCFIRADGSPKFVMQVTLIGGVINIIGDYVFVFPMGMGMAGAAIATVLGSVIQALMLVIYILLRKTSLKAVAPYNWLPCIIRILQVGFGAGINPLAIIVMTFITNNQIMKYANTSALAIYGMLATVAALLNSVFSGVGQAAQPIISENFGAGKLDRCIEARQLGIRIATVMGSLFSLICLLFPVEITTLFMQMTQEINEQAGYIVRIYAISFLPQAINVFIIYYLQSMVLPNQATVVSLLRGLIVNSILLYLLPVFMGGNGIWWAILATEVIAMLVGIVYFKVKPRERG